MYRKDVLERIDHMIAKEEIAELKPNFSEIAKQCGCDYRTAKAAFERIKSGGKGGPSRPPVPSKLDPFKDQIIEKLEIPCTVASIFHFIRKRGYEGGATILKKFCRKYREERIREATMRFETLPGMQAQVDWKEEMKFVDSNGESHTVNIFLMVMGFSRMKYIELTIDRSQDTLMNCILNAIEYFGGAPREILFDNMKTVSDRARGDFGRGVVNERFYEFAKDCGFEPLLCRAYRPQTKGKAEALAKLVERLRPYNGEFVGVEGLSSVVDGLRDDLNRGVSLATMRPPIELHEREREHLRMPETDSIREAYLSIPVERKVARDSTVCYRGSRYSVNPRFIGKRVTLSASDGKLLIYINKELVAEHKITGKRFNYSRGDYEAIMKSGAYRDAGDETIEEVAGRNLEAYDLIG